ncbi:MAG: FAD-dependent oxidoreductase [Dehalococcoidia bacterium]
MRPGEKQSGGQRIVTGRAVIVGGDIAGVQAALEIADSGIKATLIEPSPSLPSPEPESIFLRPLLLQAASHPNIEVVTGAEVTRVESEEGKFTVKISQQPRYVDFLACTSCGRCTDACPVNLVDPDSGALTKAVHLPGAGLKSVPSTRFIEKRGVAPCSAACPAGINANGYLALISKGKFREALALVRESNPFPHILGRVCTHPCESACTRGKVDQPIAIASLKRFLADYEAAQQGLGYIEEMDFEGSCRVAIVGAGPAGLTCAHALARMKHRSTIFEALSVPGGMVAVGMPRFRLPHEIREAEISAIIRLGVQIRTDTVIGRDLTFDDLRERGYQAIFVAIGAHKNRTLDIEGEDLDGVINTIIMLRNINLKNPVKLGDKVAIIGGGYTAIDSARSAIRLGCKEVTILYRRTANEMSATPAEILETTEEGVRIEYLVAPVKIVGENGKVKGVQCQRMKLGEPDESGRASPVPIEGSEFLFEADTVIPAIGQLPDLGMLNSDALGLKHDGTTLKADPVTLETNLPGIFAGGDAVYGPRSMVEAVGDGRRAALSIHRYLGGEDLSAGRTYDMQIPVTVDLDRVHIPPGKRRRIPVLPVEKRKRNFEEVETGYTTFMALREAKRCLNCAGCSECMECVRACELEAIDHQMQLAETDLQAGAIVFTAEPQIELPEGTYVIDEKKEAGLLNASAVAARVIADLAEHRQSSIPAPLENVPGKVAEPKLGVFICRCGGGISDIIDVPELLVHFIKHKDVVFVHQVGYACSDEGASEIRELARRHGLTHVVVAACACCGLDQICYTCSDRRMECKNKLLSHSHDDGLYYEFVNIREHCAWVHTKEPERALAKAEALIEAGVGRAIEAKVSETKTLPLKQSAVVIGGGPAGRQAAGDLAEMGIGATLIAYGKALSDSLSEELKQKGAEVIEGASLKDVEGTIGDYTVTIDVRGKARSLSAGAIVVDLGVAGKKRLPSLLELAKSREDNEFDRINSRVPGIFLCGSSTKDDDIASIEGSAAAGRVSALLGRGEIHSVQTAVTVDPKVCRGCGTCAEICAFGAASLVEEAPGVFISRIDASLCRGCGTCLAHCPSGAISQSGLTDEQIFASLEAMLTI